MGNESRGVSPRSDKKQCSPLPWIILGVVVGIAGLVVLIIFLSTSSSTKKKSDGGSKTSTEAGKADPEVAAEAQPTRETVSDESPRDQPRRHQSNQPNGHDDVSNEHDAFVSDEHEEPSELPHRQESTSTGESTIATFLPVLKRLKHGYDEVAQKQAELDADIARDRKRLQNTKDKHYQEQQAATQKAHRERRERRAASEKALQD